MSAVCSSVFLTRQVKPKRALTLLLFLSVAWSATSRAKMVTTSEGITSSLAILVFLLVQGTAGSSLLQGIAEPAPPAPLAHSGAACSRSACTAAARCASCSLLAQAPHRPAASHSACCRSEQAPFFIPALLAGLSVLASGLPDDACRQSV